MSDAPPKQPVTGTDSVRMDTGAGLPPYQGANTIPDPVPVTPASHGADAGMSASAALVSMHNAAAAGDADGLQGEPWAEVRHFLEERSRERVLKGFSAAEITVVSSDRHVQWQCHQAGAAVMNSEIISMQMLWHAPADRSAPL